MLVYGVTPTAILISRIVLENPRMVCVTLKIIPFHGQGHIPQLRLLQTHHSRTKPIHNSFIPGLSGVWASRRDGQHCLVTKTQDISKAGPNKAGNELSRMQELTPGCRGMLASSDPQGQGKICFSKGYWCLCRADLPEFSAPSAADIMESLAAARSDLGQQWSMGSKVYTR